MTKLTTEEIISKIPALKIYASNPDIVAQLYEELNPKRDLAGLQEGDYVNGADVLVVRVLGTSSYIGCPVCYTKKGDVEEGVSFECSNARCNNQRVATKLTKWTLLAGDETTKAILDFPPFAYKIDDGSKYVAKVVNIRGKVTGMREQKVDGATKAKTPVIMVRDMKVVSDIRDEQPDASLETKQEAPNIEKVASTSSVFPTPSSPPSPSEITLSIGEAKQKAFTLWMSFQSGPVAETQLLAYLSNNLKATLEDVLPLLEFSYADNLKANVYKLKTRPT